MKIGSLFSGYGGLDLGVQRVVGGDVAWHVEFDAAPSAILAHHWPDVPNYGDVTAVDWSTVEPVDVLTGGFPCQDVSLAGLRRGLRDGTRSGLWSEFARAIDALRPGLVVIENVRGLLSATADRQMESSPWGVGDRHDGPALRALGAVLGDLAELGYDAEWCGLRAADAGAPHGRFRVFVIATPRDTDHPAGSYVRSGGAVSASRASTREARSSLRGIPGVAGGAATADARYDRLGVVSPAHDDDRALALRDDVDGCAAADTAGCGRDGRTQVVVGSPVERASAARGGGTTGAPADAERRGGERRRGHGLLASAPRAGEGDRRERERDGYAADDRGAAPRQWGPFGPAVERWERITGRVAPAPANPDGRDGAHRLAPEFVEWMMGLPAGHVTGESDDAWRARLLARSASGLPVGMRGSVARWKPLTRAQQLKALGNGVVPQQAALAVRTLLERVATA
jgi:DNA (cytosine-5)-methyltransferase 1